MINFRLILYVIAFFCFAFSAANVPSKVNLQGLGLAFLTASLFVPGT